MKSSVLFFVLLISGLAHAGVDKVTCKTFVDGIISEFSVDFSQSEYDQLGFKIVTLIEKNGFSYDVQTFKNHNNIILTKGKINPDGSVKAVSVEIGSSPLLKDSENLVLVNCF